MLAPLYIALILTYFTGNELLSLCRNSKKFANIIKKYGKLFNITRLRPDITDDDLKYFEKVKSIDLCLCRNITDTGIRHLKSIHSINLSFCGQITDVYLYHLRGVHTIDLYACDQITDIGLAHLSDVTNIILSHCKITDAGLAHLKKVRNIELRFCSGITQLQQGPGIIVSYCNKSHHEYY